MRTSSASALPIVLLLALASGAALVPAAATPGTLVVGFAPGAATPAAALAAGELVAVDPELGIALVRVADATSALAALQDAPGVDFAQLDGAVRASGLVSAGSTWDSSTWDSSRWDGLISESSRWDSSRWDSSRWDSSRWDSSRWDSSRWDSSRWDSNRWDSNRWDSNRWDSTQWDSTRWDSSRWDSNRWDSTRWDGSPFTADPLLGYQWALAHLGVPDAWVLSMGSMQRTICVVDTGVDGAHPDLAGVVLAGANFVGRGSGDVDDAGHGTHMAGVAAAPVGNGIGTAGVVNARILPVKVLNDQGIGGHGALALGIRYCADNGAHVISMSLSSTEDSPAVRRAVAYAAASGALLIASAGNADDCAGCPIYPAAYPDVLAVAALGMDGQSAAFADPAAHVDLAAPGERIAGPYRGDYALGSGTSQATALMAGLAALVWDADPTLTAAEVAELLRTSARDVGPAGWDSATGWGEPDAALAVMGAQWN